MMTSTTVQGYTLKADPLVEVLSRAGIIPGTFFWSIGHPRKLTIETRLYNRYNQDTSCAIYEDKLKNLPMELF